ncbi:tRNA-guanine(15) transglycosylase-like protein [Boletus edulis BED1]|uniref:tRNA-guanine(15) transglycosylase-like protein n=1 Tax=Boletus edulis BED1 TaxID=1328754 RepID=A0AAD4GC73_BOLED|nr:tRNA-guanine(15) transglycosylase-like protein [Boletus edulis BED1]
MDYTTNARVCRMKLAHGVTMLSTFVLVATQAAIKRLTPQQVESLGITLILNNAYHLNQRPGTKVLDEVGGAHAFQGWHRNILTDSGGFQFVSLDKFANMTEEGALFSCPFTGQPNEENISTQHSIGAVIVMQLDDVGGSLTVGPRVGEAMERQANPFAIIQGGLSVISVWMSWLKGDHVAGYAIGGLSGGEEKLSDKLPIDRPWYSMGVSFAEDLLVCVALGIDMVCLADPARRLRKHAKSMDRIDDNCPCPTCRTGTPRAMLHHMVTIETAGAHALTQHNLVFQAQVMGGARDAIWCVNALRSVGMDLLQGGNVLVIPGRGAKWDVA